MMYREFYYSTADIERFYFTGETQRAEPPPTLAPGIYRVIQGQLYRVLP